MIMGLAICVSIEMFIHNHFLQGERLMKELCSNSVNEVSNITSSFKIKSYRFPSVALHWREREQVEGNVL